LAARASPKAPLGELTALPRPSCWFCGGEGKREWGEKRRAGERKYPTPFGKESTLMLVGKKKLGRFE